MDDVVGPGRILGPQPRPFGRWRTVSALVVVGLIAWMVIWHHYFVFILYLPWFGLLWTIMNRRPTLVSAAGVSRPMRNRRFIRWEEVESVARPTAGVYGVRLKLLGGKTVLLDDIPADRSADVAAIGGKELRQPVMPRPTPRAAVRSDVEIEADVRRQAAALAEHRKAMKAQSDALHWKP